MASLNMFLQTCTAVQDRGNGGGGEHGPHKTLPTRMVLGMWVWAGLHSFPKWEDWLTLSKLFLLTKN